MSLFTELKRRNVFKVGIAYVVASWLLLQLTEVLSELLDLPDVAGRFVVLLLIIGIVPALIFAWAFEMTPEGLKREKDVDRSESIARSTGRKLDFFIIGMLVLVAGYFIWEARFKPSAPTTAATAGGELATEAPGQQPWVAVNSIAVLPFANRSRLEDDEFFTDGIHDDLLTQLAKISGLKVISRTSVMQYKGTEKTIPQIAGELGVGKVLEGGVQRAGQRIRINAQLIDVATDQHLWAETFDREMTLENLFDIQSEITQQIVRAVRGELSAEEAAALADQPTDNLEAYEAYLRARAATNLADYGRDKYEEAEPWAQRAVELDPGFAKAWALLSEIHAQAIWIGYDMSPERQQETRRALARAVALDPQDPTVMASQADIFYRLDNDYPLAYELYQKAQAAAPGDARIVLFKAITERRLGLWNEAIDSFGIAHEMDPANVFIATQMVDTLGWMNEWGQVGRLLDEWLPRYYGSRDLLATRVTQLMHSGELAEARLLYDRIPPNSNTLYTTVGNDLHRWQRDFPALIAFWDSPDINRPRFSGIDNRLLWQGIAHKFMGDAQTATTLFRQHVERLEAAATTTTNAEAVRLNSLAQAYAHLGDFDTALERARQATETQPREKDHLFGANTWNIQTWVMAMAGQRDEAIARLAATVDQPEGHSSWELALDPLWEFLRGHPGFDALVAGKQIREERGL